MKIGLDNWVVQEIGVWMNQGKQNPTVTFGLSNQGVQNTGMHGSRIGIISTVVPSQRFKQR